MKNIVIFYIWLQFAMKTDDIAKKSPLKKYKKNN